MKKKQLKKHHKAQQNSVIIFFPLSLACFPLKTAKGEGGWVQQNIMKI